MEDTNSLVALTGKPASQSQVAALFVRSMSNNQHVGALLLGSLIPCCQNARSHHDLKLTTIQLGC